MRTWVRYMVKLSESLHTNVTRLKSSINNIVKLKDKNGGNLSFVKLPPTHNTSDIINKVIAPAFLTDANYNYLYKNTKDRKLAVYDRFHHLIPSVTKSNCVNSYVLFDDDKQEPIGHVLLYSPMNENEECDSHEDTGRKFSRQLYKVSNKLRSGIKMFYLSSAMRNEYKLINKFVRCGYWEISCVSINPEIQSVGYGSLIMNEMHKVICSKNVMNNNYNIPTILFTSTPSALRFYQRLGYQSFMQHNINNEITSYSLIYHKDEVVLKLWLEHLSKNVTYYHKVDRFSFMPSFIRSVIKKREENNNEDVSLLF